MDQNLTVLVGGNGSGKTAVFVALSRLFGINSHERRIKKRDFHLATENPELTSETSLILEAIFCFPELGGNPDAECFDAVPEFFQQMTVSAPGATLKARMRLKATWTDDGTLDGSIDEDFRWITAFNDQFNWDECQPVRPAERICIQVIYVPATRDVKSPVAKLLKGRLWKAARWSQQFRGAIVLSASNLQQEFEREAPAQFVLNRFKIRWDQVHRADTDTTPAMRLIESRFDELVRNAIFTFSPDEAEGERAIEELSDGQRSLFHIALTATTLQVEQEALQHVAVNRPFENEGLQRAHLSILAIEEPENSLSPFFLSRIIGLAREISKFPTAQVALSSHSPAILGRIAPKEVRYFKLDCETRQSTVKEIILPDNDEEANKYVRLAVKAYPELYFARFIILGEGDSDRLVVHRIAQAMDIDLDPSFVPIIPLGGRHVVHFWRLLKTLGIPSATLLDLDLGRRHGGANLVRQVTQQLRELGHEFEEINLQHEVEGLRDETLLENWENGNNVLRRNLADKGVFFSHPLDIDFSMLRAFGEAYKCPNPGGREPNVDDEASQRGKAATLKRGGNDALYSDCFNNCFAWYPYLFLNKSKPGTHIAALSRIDNGSLAENSPSGIKNLVYRVKRELWPAEVNQ